MNQVRADLPPEAEVPAINIEPSDAQIAAMYLSFGSTILEDNQVTDYLIRVVQPRLSAIEGVQRADILGGRTFAIRAWLKPDRMAALERQPVAGARRRSPPTTTSPPSGRPRARWSRSTSPPTTDLQSRRRVQEARRPQQDGALVRLEDVADVVLGADDYDQDVRFSGKKAVFMGVWVLPERELARRHRARPQGDRRRSRASCPTGMQATVAFDSTEYIDSAIHEVVAHARSRRC